jgi:HD-GYP domain-containing protein (c-di-GMP phosphodiesterase class II)
MHDLGKLGVSNLILDKPGRLTDDEIAAMRQHPKHTRDILSRVGCFSPIAAVAAAHHERLDGAGYDCGMSAETISLSSRILAVADICDALRASRPYREGLPPERILDIMKREVGTAIDPDCYSALDDVLRHVPIVAGADAPAVQVVAALSEDYQQAA